jgi:hypothetical protein
MKVDNSLKQTHPKVDRCIHRCSVDGSTEKYSKLASSWSCKLQRELLFAAPCVECPFLSFGYSGIKIINSVSSPVPKYVAAVPLSLILC